MLPTANLGRLYRIWRCFYCAVVENATPRKLGMIGGLIALIGVMYVPATSLICGLTGYDIIIKLYNLLQGVCYCNLGYTLD
ncbi:hypothetical protein SPTER_14680 [Sporomusa termitida]|uniref:Uncharacterized protein n=1 Tax=Sporomusa termitida TaxID=2377 RepID=A0A517DS22_9FIRM|nr:hypothetical protein SPTER_14680 [Sporomusa termitida]